MAALAKEDFQHVIRSWRKISTIIHEPTNSREYNKLSNLLDGLLDIVGEDESHELIGLVDIISHMISMYDDRNEAQANNLSGVDALKYLMEQHHLKQTELNEIGSQGVVSEILNGKRSLNISQIKKLSKRFHVSASTFINE